MTNIANQTKGDNSWVTRHVINFAYTNYTKTMKKKLAEDETLTLSTTPTSSGGRQKGDTYLKRKHRRDVIAAAKNEITKVYKDEKNRCNQMGKYFLLDGWKNHQ